jgi:uncharacterized MAPEG superfamily protein
MIAAGLPHSIAALIFYALWTIALVLMVAADRVLEVMRGQSKLTSFTPGAPHGSDSYWRINRAHLNATENLPIFGAIVLAGWAAGAETPLFNELAIVVLVGRVVQSIIHILSGSSAAIMARFTAYGVQLVCEIWMAVLILHTARVF